MDKVYSIKQSVGNGGEFIGNCIYFSYRLYGLEKYKKTLKKALIDE